MTNPTSDPRRAKAGAKVEAGSRTDADGTGTVVPFGIAAARAHDRTREARGETSWTRPAFPGEWDLTIPPGAPDVTVMVQVDVLGPGVRVRHPAYLVPREVSA